MSLRKHSYRIDYIIMWCFE